MVEVVPYRMVGALELELSSISNCQRQLGEPLSFRVRSETTDLYYDGMIARFGKENGLLVEVTLLPPQSVLICGIVFDWQELSLRQLCTTDGSPLLVVGFVLMTNLGVAITGVHDADCRQRALTAFRRGAFDQLLPQASAFKRSQETTSK